MPFTFESGEAYIAHAAGPTALELARAPSTMVPPRPRHFFAHAQHKERKRCADEEGDSSENHFFATRSPGDSRHANTLLSGTCSGGPEHSGC